MATLCVPYAPAVAPQGNKTSPPCRPKFPYHFGPLGLAQPEQIMPSSNLRVGSGIYGLSASKRPPAVFTSDGAPKSEASNEGTREQRTGQDMGCVPRSSFVAPTDPEIEALIRRISENVVIRDMAIKSPKYVQVPNGYSMDCGITPSEFYATRKEVRNHAKKRKREAAVPNINMSRRELADERHGFRAEEVNRNGAISIQDCKPSTLSNDIHPLFDRSNFDDTPDAIYDQLIPALQLASMFLMQPICMQYWVTLAMGHRADDAEMSAKNGKLSQRIASHVELTLERAQSVIAHIKGIGKSNLIHFRFKHGLYGDRAAGVAWGLSDPICDYQGIERDYHGLKGSFVRSIIRIHADYYVIAKKLSQLKYQEVSQKLRFSFNFAVLVMHEVAHSIEGVHMRNRAEQWIDWQTSRYYKEPYWLDWQEAECGRAWEETMFGGEISPINNRVDGSHGVGITDYPSRGTDIDPERKTWSTISMRYVEQLFQMSTWQRSFDLNDWRIFNIPRDGAKSLYINSFTTMEQSEEQRAANEDLAELVALANAQPAKKMRIKSTGKREEQRAEDVEVIEEAVAEQEHQPKSSKRQVPAFTGTRRLSSVMAGALPEVSERRILKPRIRRPVSNYPIGSTSLQQRQLQLLRASKGTQILRLCASKKDTGEIYDVYERSLMSGKLMNAIIAKPQNRRGKEPTSELVKRIKRQPKGLLERYRRRRRVEAVRKQDEEGRKQGLAWTKVLGLQQKMIEKAEGKNQADGTNDPDEQPHWERQQAVAGQEEAGGRES